MVARTGFTFTPAPPSKAASPAALVKTHKDNMTSFLDLPPEVRNRIYYYTTALVPALFAVAASAGNDYPLVIKGSLIYVLNPQDLGNDDDDDDDDGAVEHTEYEPPLFFPRQPDVTRSCRQVRKETLPIFYGANPIILTVPQQHCDTFFKRAVTWFLRVQRHIPLMKDIHAPKTVIQRLQTEGLGFKGGVLKEDEGE